jgi:hypothetical protein
MSDDLRIALITGAVGVVGSCSTSLVSFISILTSTVLTVQKNKLREAELEIEKAKSAKSGREIDDDT